MNILVTGANGFVAREIINRLVSLGHHVIGCVRNRESCVIENDNVRIIQTDFQSNTEKSNWLPFLLKSNIDVVINCVGVFQTLTSKAMWDIHYNAPRALFDACQEVGIKKIIQISALGVDKSDVDYAKSKLSAETYLQSLNIDSVIIRPSFVYGKGSYGGSSLFRGLAALPFFIFLPGGGQQLLQPVHVHDLVTVVEKSLDLSGKQLLCAVGSEKLSLQSLLNKMRAWLGFKKAINIKVPLFLIKLSAKFGDFFRNAPLSTTGVKLMVIDNVVTDQAFDQLKNTVGFAPRSFTDGLNEMTSSVQDRWHARLFFLRPLLRLSIAYIWIVSGIGSLWVGLSQTFPPNFGHLPIAMISAGIMEILLGLVVLCNYRLKIVGSIQVFLMIISTIISFISPTSYWSYAFGMLTFNILLFFATLVMMALESDR